MEFSLSQPLGIAAAMEQLMSEYEDRFPEVFCSITTDNGNEFAAFSVFEALGREIFQAKKQGKFCIGKPANICQVNFAEMLLPPDTAAIKGK